MVLVGTAKKKAIFLFSTFDQLTLNDIFSFSNISSLNILSCTYYFMSQCEYIFVQKYLKIFPLIEHNVVVQWQWDYL